MTAHFGFLLSTIDTVDMGTMITRTPGIKGGTPHIAGTGVTVQTVVRWYTLGLSPEEIAAEYPHVGLGHVYAALAYYPANERRTLKHSPVELQEWVNQLRERFDGRHITGNSCGLDRIRFGAVKKRRGR